MGGARSLDSRWHGSNAGFGRYRDPAGFGSLRNAFPRFGSRRRARGDRGSAGGGGRILQTAGRGGRGRRTTVVAGWTRFAFYTEWGATSSLRLANASGGGSVVLDSTKAGTVRGLAWSPDGQWISYLRSISGKRELVKIRALPGAAPENAGQPQHWQLAIGHAVVADGRVDRVSGRERYQSDFARGESHA